MENVNFITCGDDGYGATMSFMARNVAHLYPGARAWVYDWGLKKDTREKMERLSNVNIVDWKNITGPKLRIYIAAQRLGWFCDNALFRRAGLGFDSMRHHIGFDYISIEKIKCFIDLSDRVGDQPIVFFDGDAFPIRHVDALHDPAFDISLTIRRDNEIRWDFNACGVLNLGVAGFGADSGKRDKFLRYWLRLSQERRERLADQTAMTRIIEEQDRNILRPGGQGTVEIEGIKFNVQVLSCNEYNFNHIEELIGGDDGIPESIRILHFKSGRFNQPQLQPVIAQADLGRSGGH